MTASGHFGTAAAASYLHQDIVSETPLALIARVYNMATIEISRARTALTSRNFAAKGVAVRQACLCISLLQCSLNREEGGEVAANLDRIYDYLLRRLTHAHITNDQAIFAEMAGHLAELGAAWREVADREKPKHAAGALPLANPSAALAVAT